MRASGMLEVDGKWFGEAEAQQMKQTTKLSIEVVCD